MAMLVTTAEIKASPDNWVFMDYIAGGLCIYSYVLLRLIALFTISAVSLAVGGKTGEGGLTVAILGQV
jgi:hypothetical protein